MFFSLIVIKNNKYLKVYYTLQQLGVYTLNNKFLTLSIFNK